MKRTMKTLFCLLLALVLALQIGALAPSASADISDSAKLTVKIYAPLSDGKLNASGDMALVTDADEAGLSFTFAPGDVITVASLRSDGLMMTAPEGYCVHGLAIAANEDVSGADVGSFLGGKVSLLDVAQATTMNAREIAVESLNFNSIAGEVFNGLTGDGALYVMLYPVTSVAAQDATCGDAGHAAYYVCDGSYYINECCLSSQEHVLDYFTIAATGEHTMQAHAAVSPSCTAAGNDAYWECSTCGHLYDNAEGTGTPLAAIPTIAALDHEWSYSGPVWSSDNSECTMTRSCSREGCTSEPESEKVSTTSVTTATCTAGGTTTYTAAFTKAEFGTKTKDVEVDALGHDYGEEVTYVWNEDNSKCTAKRVCSRCGDEDIIEVVDTTSAVTTEATCKVAEVVTYTADFSVDGLVDQTKPVTGSTDPDKHTLEKHAAVAATCDSAGNDEYWACKDCGKLFADKDGATELDKIPSIPKLTTHGPLTHHEAVAATPEKDGNIEYWTCPCGKFFSDSKGEHEIAEADTVQVYVKTTYDIIEAGTDKTWQKGSSTGAKIEIDADYDSVSVTAVKLGGTALTTSQYKVTKGSVVVTIDPAALESQSEGKKEVEVTFSDGKTATSEITIEKAAEPTKLTLKIDEKGLKKTYDGTPFDLKTLQSSIKVEGLPSGYKASVSIDFEDSKVKSFYEVGTTTVKLTLTAVKDASDNDVTGSFTCDDLKGVKLTIEKRKISVETRSDSKVYDGKAWTYTHMSNPQPIMTYTDPKLTHYVRDGVDYVQSISIRYTASPKNMGTYDNSAEIIVREYPAVKNSKGEWIAKEGATATDVTKNYDITYKFGKIKITDSSGKVPAGTTPVTGDSNNIWIWIGIMAAAVVIAVVLLIVLRKGKKGGEAPSPEANE